MMRHVGMRRIVASAVFLSALLLLLFASPASASIDVAGWTFHNLSSLNIPITFGLAFDDQRIAWTKWDDRQSDVYIADISTGASSPITDTPTTERAVAIDGDHLVWVAYSDLASDKPGDLHLYDLASHEDEVVAHGWIETENGPQIKGAHVAWGQYGDSTPGQPSSSRALYVYSIGRKATVLVSDKLVSGGGNSGGQRTFVLGPDYLAYVEAEDPTKDGEVWLVNLSTLEKTKLGTSAADSLHVSLAGDLVTWAAPGAGPAVGGGYQPHDIFTYRISTGETKKIATRYAPEPFPKTDGRFVVWDTYTGSPIYTENLRTIQAYNTETGETIDVSHNLYLNFTPEIANGIVTWERGGEADSVIMAHDLLSGQTTQLAADRGFMDQLSQVKGRTVAWWGLHFTDYGEVVRFRVAKAPDSYPDPFHDVSGTHRYRTAILGVAEKGIATGYPVGSQRVFRPEAPLLRAQFAKMVTEAFDIPVTEDMVSPFTDLGPDDPDNLYPHEYVAALAARGIIRGVAARSFDPYAPLTRAQAVSILVRTLDALHHGLLTNDEGQAPGAENWDAPHRGNLRRAYANDLLVSLIDWVKPWDALAPATRGEAAQMIWNALELIDQTLG